MIIIKSLIIIACIAIYFYNSLGISAQVGINTLNPTGTLTIEANTSDTGTKVARIVNSSNTEIFTILDNGKIGLVNEQPITAIDLRGLAKDQSLAIGMADISAEDAKEGALRYVYTARALHYSNGTEWVNLQSSITRPYLVAPNNYVAGLYPSNTTTRLTGFVASFDSYGSFNQSTSTYTAPKDGMYLVSFTISFNRAVNISGNSYILGTWTTSTGRTIKSIQAFPVGGTGQVGITCSGTIYLSSGETIYPEVWHNLGGTKSLRTYGNTANNPTSDMGFNQLFVFAQ